MERGKLTKEIVSLKFNNILLELPTGIGKSKLALEFVKSRITEGKLLIVYPKNVLKQTWEEELSKWWKNCRLNIEFTTYVSLPKHLGNWDAVIFDEAHHLSERCRESLASFNIKYSILLSATVNYPLKDELREIFENLYVHKITIRKAINDNILPDPKVILFPMTLDNYHKKELLVVNKNCKNEFPQILSISEYWSCRKNKKWRFLLGCTEQEYYNTISNDIEYYKSTYFRSKRENNKNIWLQKCGERLKWLSDKKNNIVKDLLKELSNRRTIVFCNSIMQTEILGKYCINSKNKESANILENFNNGIIHHITSCSMINEGINLKDCQIGIYASLNSSDTIIKQRLGRLLRHKNPIVIIPYFKGTRDEEIVNNMLKDYNPELIEVITKNNELNNL